MKTADKGPAGARTGSQTLFCRINQAQSRSCHPPGLELLECKIASQTGTRWMIQAQRTEMSQKAVTI